MNTNDPHNLSGSENESEPVTQGTLTAQTNQFGELPVTMLLSDEWNLAPGFYEIKFKKLPDPPRK